MQEQAKLVGPEAVTAQAVGLERPLEVLDGVFAGVGSLHVATVVQLLGVTSKIGHHEANVRALLGVLGFDDHAVAARPALATRSHGAISDSLEQAGLVPRAQETTARLLGEFCGQALEPLVGAEADKEVDLVVLT